ncbi:hypothetical protein [Roseomonas sp. BN140053]|uniref:hypothetical protein n=1 Tax=Roseomonas sp. BN140053 TaxID=3391898 RepID=UPI0039E73404
MSDAPATFSATTDSITVQVPLSVRRRPGRKTIVTPEGVSGPAVGPEPSVIRAQADPVLVKALARAHRWKRLLDEGRYASLTELAAAEKLERGFLGRLLQLTLLAPDIVEAILDGCQASGLGLPRLMDPFPTNWAEQHDALGLSTSPAMEGHRV